MREVLRVHGAGGGQKGTEREGGGGGEGHQPGREREQRGGRDGKAGKTRRKELRGVKTVAKHPRASLR